MINQMHNMKNIFKPVYVFFSILILSNISYGIDDSALLNLVSSQLNAYQNPLEGKILLISEQVNFSDTAFESFQKEHENIKNNLKHEYVLFFENNNIHQQQNQIFDDGIRNIRDLYLNNGFVYLKDSMNPNFIEICDLDEKDEFWVTRILNAYTKVFSIAKNAIDNFSADIGKASEGYFLSWSQDSKKYLLQINPITLYPTYLEVRFENGDLYEKINIVSNGEKFEIVRTTYNFGNEIFCVNNVSIRYGDVEDFSKNTVPEKLGYRNVKDTRGNETRRYLAFNNLPDKKFLDELFKNPDDVVRYNTEIHRLAHPNEFEDE